MSKAKGLFFGILAGAAAVVAFKALPKAKQDQLTEKAQETGVLLRDKAYDAAYAAADLAGDVTEKAKAKATELKSQSQEKYGDQLDSASGKLKGITGQAAPYVDKAKDFVSPYVAKTQDAIADLRDKFASEDIELTQDDVDLESALADLADEEKADETVAEETSADVEEVSAEKAVDELTDETPKAN